MSGRADDTLCLGYSGSEPRSGAIRRILYQDPSIEEVRQMAELVPTELDRVRDHTARSINEKIDRGIAENIRNYAVASPQVLSSRIEELETEWDIERILETNASSIAFIGTLLGAFVNPWFLLIPGIVTAFLFQHATQGWCPPLPILRRMGKRTRNEIDVEKFGLKALRGDFAELRPISDRNEFADRVIMAMCTRSFTRY